MVRFSAKCQKPHFLAHICNFWMIQNFWPKKGSVSFFLLSISNFMQKIRMISWPVFEKKWWRTNGRTNGLTNMGDLIGPNPTKVGGPKSRKSLEPFSRKTDGPTNQPPNYNSKPRSSTEVENRNMADLLGPNPTKVGGPISSPYHEPNWSLPKSCQDMPKS